MKPLYSQKEFDSVKSTYKLPLECYACDNTFYKVKKDIANAMRDYHHEQAKYCSRQCYANTRKKSKNVNCSNCNIQFEKKLDQIKKYKNHFCSRSCAATYNNKNKTTGTRRSKLEIWVESELTKFYPDLDIHFNQKDTIGSELDIYIPELNLAFELNGIFHYQPIFGTTKFNQIQENDQNKYKACLNQQIDLCIIDTSGQKYFKPERSKKYLDIITNIIKERLSTI